jgi:hypothetical protein
MSIGLRSDELKRMQLQHGFISGVVSPLWSSLRECFPCLEESMSRLLINKQRYADRIDALSQEKETAPSIENIEIVESTPSEHESGSV